MDELRALAMSFSIQEDVGNPDGVYDPLGEFADGDEKEGVQYDSHGHAIAAPGSASLFSCVMNLANTILGAGMLGLPNAFAKSGYGLGMVFLSLFAVMSAFGLHLLSEVALRLFKDTRDASFYGVASAAFPQGALVIDIAVAIKCFGVGTSYLVVIGDLLPVAMGDMGAPAFFKTRQVVITLMMAVVVPLCCLKSLDALRFTSTLSLVFVAFMTIVIFLYAATPLDACTGGDECPGSTTGAMFNDSTAKILTIFIFGYTCHQNILPICNEVRDFTSRRINSVIGISIGSAFATYTIIAVSGYYTFGNLVKADVLENYPQNALLTISRIFVSALTALSFPLQAFPCRNSVMQILKSTVGEAKSPRVTMLRWWIITACICSLAWLISMVVTDLGIVLAVVGATGSTTISYILPGFVFFKLEKEWTLKRVAALALFIAGCIIIPTALTVIFL